MVGIFGDIRFRVSENQILTFSNFKQEISSAWNAIDRIGQKPMVEYGGADLQKVSLEIILDASLGVKPKTLLKRLERMAESAESYDLVIGKKLIGTSGKWVITKCTQAYHTILRGGEIYKATVSLSLQEYV